MFQIKSDENLELSEFLLNNPTKGSLSDNSYHFYRLILDQISSNNQQNLILRVDEDKSTETIEKTQYYFSDPDIYVSQENKYPKDPQTSTWYCNEFGNDIVAISKEYIYSNSTFYLSVYCKKKCNYILNSYLDVSYKLQPYTIYGFHIPRKKSMVYEFKTRHTDFEHLSIQLMGVTPGQYNAYINKEIPSSSKSYILEPAWSNGYSYDLYKDSPEYCTNCKFYILVKALEQDAIFRILLTYRDDALLINQGTSLFDTIKGEKNRCYYYPMNNFPKKDSLIMNFFLFGGSMIAKIFGFDMVMNKTYADIVNTQNTYEIIGDRVLIFSNQQIEQFKNESIGKKYDYFHFCLYSKQKSSYLLGLHYSSLTQAMQGLNFLNIGQSIKDYLPMNQITKYKLLDLSYESNIKISLESLQGKPKLYFMFQSFPFMIHKHLLNQYKFMQFVLEPNINGDKQSIFASNEKNYCHQRSKYSLNPGEVTKTPCVSAIIIECELDKNANISDIKNDCIYKLSTIADKSKQLIKQRTTYKGLLSKDDYNDFLFNIDDDNVIKFTIVLNTVSGELKLSLYNIDKGEENKIFIEEKNNKDFLPKIINVQNTNEMFKDRKNLKGKYMIRINSNTFSLYALYFYTYDNSLINKNNQIDLYSVDLNLINGQMIQDFFDNKLFKVYNYEIYESNFKDIRITVTQRNLDLNIYIYDNVNKIEYEFLERKNNYLKEIDIMKDFDKIINFKNYLWTNLYDAKQIIIPYNELVQKVRKDKTLLFIVIAKKYYSSKNKNEISFLNQNTFYLGVTNNVIPLYLFENIPHQMTLNKIKNFSEQKYHFVHSDNAKKLSFAINVIVGAIDFQIEIKKTKVIFYKNDFINRNEFVSISPENLYKYCQNSGCELILTIKQISKENPTYMIFAHSNEERPLQLSPGVLIQNQIQVGENHFYILDFNPLENDDKNKLGNILMRFRGGKVELYMKFYKYDVDPEIGNFPSENNYDYIGESTYAGKILHLDKDLYEKCMEGYSNDNNEINNNEIENYKTNKNNCRFFLTIKGIELSFYSGTRIEYSLFYSHSVLEINQGIPYTSSISAGEINYFKFSFDSNTKGIYITLYSSIGDADMYINFGNNLPSFNNYIWRSFQSQMDTIFIDINDNFFVDNKKSSLEGLYTIMIYGYTNSTYTLTVSQGQHKIIQLVQGTPSICKVSPENNEKSCYFRVDNFVNSKKVLEQDSGGLSNIIQKSTEVIEKDVHIVFSTKFIYGEGNIYVKLFNKTETEINIENFPNENKNDYSNDVLYYNKNIKRNFLKIDIKKDNENLTPYSMLLISVKCKDNCLFEMNSAKIEYDINFQFIEIGRENLFYINNQKEPYLLTFLYQNNEQLNYEFFSYTGNAQIKLFYNESYYDKDTNKSKFDFNNIANFKIEKNIPYYNYLSEIDKKKKIT